MRLATFRRSPGYTMDSVRTLVPARRFLFPRGWFRWKLRSSVCHPLRHRTAGIDASWACGWGWHHHGLGLDNPVFAIYDLTDQLVVCSVQTSLAFPHHAVVPSGLSAEGEVLF